MYSGVISEMGYVTLQASDIERSLQHAHDILGLKETGRSGGAVFLTSSARRHHELVYLDSTTDALNHIGLVARDLKSLDVVRGRVRDRGLEILSNTPLHPGVSDGFVFRGPEDFAFEIYVGMEERQLVPAPHGPDRFGHVNLHPQDVAGMKDFLVDVLDFKVTDIIGSDFVYFLRCNPDHHGIALVRGRGWMHHHAWQVQSIADLGKLGDRIWESGSRLLMGPVRHGGGHNIAAYYVEPSGAVVEVYTDLQQIYDENFEPRYWDADDTSWFSRWSLYDVAEFRSHGVFPAGAVALKA
jgi:catechol 2,3-dioxygenase